MQPTDLEPMVAGQLKVTVVRVEQFADVLFFDVENAHGTLPGWKAGAHVDIAVGIAGSRPYSLAGDPAGRDVYTFGVLRDPHSKGGSAFVHDHVAVGRSLMIGQPRNVFPLRPVTAREHVVLVGGGIGITPLLPMAYDLARQGRNFSLHYVARNPVLAPLLMRLPFRDHVTIHACSRARGQAFDPQVLFAPAAAGQSQAVYVCGPEGMMDAVTQQAIARGVPAGSVYREQFAPPAHRGHDAGEFEVVAARSGVSVRVVRDETISDALIRMGVDVPVSCEVEAIVWKVR